MEKTLEPESSKSNGKIIKITTLFCWKWGFNGVIRRFNILINNLVEKGYKVSYKIDTLFPGQGQYFIYVNDKKNKKRIVFSNDENKHKNAIIGYEINKDNVEDVIKKIEEVIK